MPREPRKPKLRMQPKRASAKSLDHPGLPAPRWVRGGERERSGKKAHKAIFRVPYILKLLLQREALVLTWCAPPKVDGIFFRGGITQLAGGKSMAGSGAERSASVQHVAYMSSRCP